MSDTKKPKPRVLQRSTFHKRTANLRSVKMFYPECRDDKATGFQGCQDVPGAEATLWWKECIKKGHDPYHRSQRREERKPKLEEVSPGRYKQTGEDIEVWFESEPNLMQVQITPRVSGTLYGFDPITWAKANGYLFPSEHPTLPVADICEYHQCWAPAKVKTEWGKYCTEDGAKLVAMDLREKVVEQDNAEKFRSQLDAIRI